jgi:hypothetical protein
MIPNPGSHEALRLKCSCSPTQNQFGRGWFVSEGGSVRYLVDPKCPLHAESSEAA